MLMLGRKELILLFDRLDEKSETEPILIYFRLPLLGREWGEILSGNGLVEDTQENIILEFVCLFGFFFCLQKSKIVIDCVFKR